MKNKAVQIGGILIVFVALAALIGATMTFAQDDDPEATPEAEPVPEVEDTPAMPGMGMMMGMGHGRMAGGHSFDGEAYDAALADELGITVEEL